ncbi:phage minor capsid protein [Actinomadura montaniterrae]|uniref:Minor capsid protein n=1 Tax=Actinomadura montaniterrae TaxID=1803903 RepID=A0A6L3VX90_9ACTN|nr:phage minor capsid protein [Actinomadura montaniterrae]KAB2384748.1 hypothetical protein F9B16_09885 [Actinomadura montaniterrae]
MAIPAPVSPALAEGLPRVVVALHAGWEETTIRFMAEQLGPRIGSPEWAAGQQRKLAAIQRDLDATVRRLAATAGPQIEQMIADAYRRGHGAPPTPARRRGLVQRVMDAMRRLWGRLPRRVSRAYARAVTLGTRAPDDRRRTVVQAELDRIASRGLVGGVDDHGRTLSLVPQVETALQTAAGNAAMDGYLDSVTAAGDDLVMVLQSAHPCPLCLPWEHRVLSVSGHTPGRPSMATARAAGLWHPRCHHQVVRYEPGVSEHLPHAARHKRGSYAATQRQRAIERHIREWKRREAAAMDDTARLLARRKVRHWQAALRQHIATHGLQRSRQRERVDFGHTPSIRHGLGD